MRSSLGTAPLCADVLAPVRNSNSVLLILGSVAGDERLPSEARVAASDTRVAICCKSGSKKSCADEAAQVVTFDLWRENNVLTAL